MWNFDISRAPRGSYVIRNRKFGKGAADTKVFEPVAVLLQTKCGQEIVSQYLPADGQHRPRGRWEGLATGEQPVAWTHWPTHPEAV